MSRPRAYALLCGVLGVLIVIVGLVLFAQFFRFHAPGGATAIQTGPMGHYFVAFCGCALVAWGGCLLGAARRPLVSRAVGTATAVGLVLSALYRMMAWVVGDYALLGGLPRFEAALFLLLALAFVWLRPPHPPLHAGANA